MTPFTELEKLIKRNPSVFDELSIPSWKFINWLENNEQVYEVFKKYAWQLKRGQRRDRYGAATIYQRMRWDTWIRETSISGFKLNNNWISFLSRLLMLEQPKHFTDFFDTRVQSYDKRWDEIL